MNVLVTDGENRSSLAVTRSLGRKGFKVVVTSRKNPCLSSVSKYCQLGLHVPDPIEEGENFVGTIIDISAMEKIDFIFPMTDQTIILLNRARKSFPKFTTLACPSEEKMNALSNKVNLFRMAENLNLPIPRTLYLTSNKELLSIIDNINKFPVVVKPAFSKIHEKGSFLTGGVDYAGSKDELIHLYKTRSILQYPSMIQEKIIGPGTGLFTLYDENHHMAIFSHRRLREKPPSGGVSVLSESIPLDEAMVKAADKILSAVSWNGVAMVEFKRDERDGKAKLMEVNGRFWGTLQLAINCGIDFPNLLLGYLQGVRNPFPFTNYLIGHKLKWFFGSLDHLIIRLKEKQQEPISSPVPSSKWRALIDFLKVWEKDTSFDVFAFDDPKPFWLEGRLYFRDIFHS